MFNVTSAENSATGTGEGISGTSVLASASIIADGCGATISDAGNNIDAGTSCGLTTGSNTNPVLGLLQDNGGARIGAPSDDSPRLTRAIDLGSPALDRVPGNCLDHVAAAQTSDARGFARPQDGDGNGSVNCDAGAFEKAGVAPPVTTTPPPGPTGQRAAALKKCAKIKNKRKKKKCKKRARRLPV